MSIVQENMIAKAEELWAKHYHSLTWPCIEYTWRQRLEDILEGNVIDAEHVRVLLGAAAKSANADPATERDWMIDRDYVADCVGALASAEWRTFTDKYPTAMRDLIMLVTRADKAVTKGHAPVPKP